MGGGPMLGIESDKGNTINHTPPGLKSDDSSPDQSVSQFNQKLLISRRYWLSRLSLDFKHLYHSDGPRHRVCGFNYGVLPRPVVGIGLFHALGRETTEAVSTLICKNH